MSNANPHAKFVAYVKALTKNEAASVKLFDNNIEAIKIAGKALFDCYETNPKGSKARADMKQTLGISGWDPARVSNLVTIGEVANIPMFADCIKSSIQLSARRIKAKGKELDAEIAPKTAETETAETETAETEAKAVPLTLQDIVNAAVNAAKANGFSAAELLGAMTDKLAAEMPKPRRTSKAA